MSDRLTELCWDALPALIPGALPARCRMPHGHNGPHQSGRTIWTSPADKRLAAVRAGGWHITVTQQLSGPVMFIQFSKYEWRVTKTPEECGALGDGLLAALEAELATAVFGTLGCVDTAEPPPLGYASSASCGPA